MSDPSSGFWVEQKDLNAVGEQRATDRAVKYKVQIIQTTSLTHNHTSDLPHTLNNSHRRVWATQVLTKRNYWSPHFRSHFKVSVRSKYR